MSKCLIGGVFRDGYDPYHLNRVKCTKAEKIDTMAFWLWREKRVDHKTFILLRRFAYYGKNVGLTRQERREAAVKSMNPSNAKSCSTLMEPHIAKRSKRQDLCSQRVALKIT